jgi:hypothetical protein
MLKTQVPAKLSEQYPKEKYNSLLPSQSILQSVNPLYVARIETVQISSDPDDGEVYPMSAFGGDENKFCLAKPALNKLAQVAGISFLPQYTGRVDNGSNPDRVEYRATAIRRGTDGGPVMATNSFEVDMVTEENDLRRALRKKAKRKGWSKEYIDEKVEEMMLKLRKHKVAKADTGAHLRCVRDLLGIKSGYRREELKKEFVVARIDFLPDLSDPRTKDVMIRRGASAIGDLYAGPSVTPAITAPPAMTPSIVDAETEPVEEEAGESEPEKEEDDTKEMETEVRKLMVEEVITEEERRKIKAGLEQGMDEEGLKKGLKWLKNQIERRGAILRREKEEARGEQLRMPWEKGE